jgi:spore germination protein
MRRAIAMTLLLALPLLAGCGDTDRRIIEDVGFIAMASYDALPGKTGKRAKDEGLYVGISVPIVDPKAKQRREVLGTEARSSKDARLMLAARTDRTLVSGQLRNAVFGAELAKRGIWEQMDTLRRDPYIGQRVKISVVNGNAFELLSAEFGPHRLTAQYLNDLLNKEAAEHVIPLTMLFKFAREYFDDGIDPVAPVLRNAGDHIEIDGIGLFQDDRLVGKIDLDAAPYFSLLRGSYRSGELSLELENGDHAMLNFISNRRKLKVTRASSNIVVDVSLRIEGQMLEYFGDSKLIDPDNQAKLERAMEEAIAKKCEDVVRTMQAKKADAIGFGQYVRNRIGYARWKKLDWRETFPRIDVRVTVDVLIRDYGLVT